MEPPLELGYEFKSTKLIEIKINDSITTLKLLNKSFLLVILEIIKIPNTHEMKLTDDVSDASQMLVVSGRPAMTKIEAE